MNNLVLVLGDQLNPESAALDGFEPERDALWMAEVAEESTHVWSHKARIALFLSAMRHFAAAQRQLGRQVVYWSLETHRHQTLAEALSATLRQTRPTRLKLVRPGDWRVTQHIEQTAREHGLPITWCEDRHFIMPLERFADWADHRRQWRMEYWYREVRRATGLLMADGEPIGGQWNFDAENRGAFPATGPGWIPPPERFPPDAITQEVLSLVDTRFTDHPGSLDAFDWPVTPEQAQAALENFIAERLPAFGAVQDAMWQDEPWLYHSRLSAALNLRLIDPLSVCRAAEAAYHRGHAPLAAVEGFIRQIAGWREFVRGLYHRWMPDWLDWNNLEAHAALPEFFWTGQTEMNCLGQTLGQTLKFGYAHHIQRLMVTGLYSLLLGVHPRAIHAWYLAVYVDAVEWVELPNVIGMSQFADGGRMASKPYIASGQYIDRMSNYCHHCRYDPKQALGSVACPFTTLYWDFLDRHEARFAGHPRLGQQVRNLARKSAEERAAIRAAADQIRANTSR
ncbi:cryptochrome/photolyase family protein [Halothiobacillus sp. DCM-1]|uniref:cryptochrome/photolyase family protein n=1 Tax=Halothiobacillus sp. DCM-1 TaxID=3112558 RepID=UPI0032495AEA